MNQMNSNASKNKILSGEPGTTINTASLSIHTFTYTLPCSKEVYNSLITLLKENCQLIPYNNESVTAYACNTFYSIGLNRIEFKKILLPTKNYKYCIVLLVNPLNMVNNPDILYNQIINVANLKDIPELLKDTLSHLSNDLTIIYNDGKITRADYCFNLWFLNQDLAELYLYDLMKMANTPNGFEEKLVYSSTKHRKSGELYALTIFCKSYEFSIYLKHSQIKEHNKRCHKKIYDKAASKDSKGQLRFELRPKRNKLYNDKKSQNLSELELISGKNQNSISTVRKLLKQMYGTGDFYTYNRAKEIIQNCPHLSKVKENMLRLLEAVKIHRTLNYSVLHEYDATITDKWFKQYMKHFNQIGLSPITLPNNCPLKYFPNPVEYFLEHSSEHLKKNDIVTFDFIETENKFISIPNTTEYISNQYCYYD